MYLLEPYDDALCEILEKGVSKTSKRTNQKTLSIFGMTRRYDLTKNRLPVMTRRKAWPTAVFGELLWFLSGRTDNYFLKQNNCHFWTPWVSHEFTQRNGFRDEVFGPVYGFQLRYFGGDYSDGDPDSGLSDSKYGQGGVDQLKYVMDRIREDPSCRRIMWSLWHPRDISRSRLPPCHVLYQILIDDHGDLTGIMTQRSADFPIGVPANIQFYSALTMMIAQQTGYRAKELVHETHDSHIYKNQIEAVQEYLSTPIVNSPRFHLTQAPSITEYAHKNFNLFYHEYGPLITIPVAV